MRLQRLFTLLTVIAVASTPWVASGVAHGSAKARPLSSSGESSSTKHFHVTMTGSFGPPTFLAPACNEAQNCVYPLERTSSILTGSLSGTSVSAGAGVPNAAGGFDAVGIHLFTGTVEGCGAGTLVWTEELASAGGGEAAGTWHIADGSGTGALESVSGSGSFESHVNADGGGTGTSTGRISCG
jgi:Protein of unknown function (DUF3224)